VQAKLFMDKHFAEPLDLNNIADEACFSKFHFIRLFKEIYGKTPHQYLTAVRIENAKAYLRKGLSVKDTCSLVGFDSVTTFVGLFRKISSSKPTVYQQEYLKRTEKIKRVPLNFIPNCFAENYGWTENRNFGELR
jgi:AraC-like DNA-binding protein